MSQTANFTHDPKIAERLNQLKERMAQRRAVEAAEVAKIVLQPERRGENLRLLRAYMGGTTQEKIGRMLKISSTSMFSNYERSAPPCRRTMRGGLNRNCSYRTGGSSGTTQKRCF